MNEGYQAGTATEVKASRALGGRLVFVTRALLAAARPRLPRKEP